MAIHSNTELTAPPLDTGGGVRSSHAAPLQAPARRSYLGVWIALAVVAFLLAIGITVGILSRAATERRLEQTTNRASVLSVTVAYPTVTGSA